MRMLLAVCLHFIYNHSIGQQQSGQSLAASAIPLYIMLSNKQQSELTPSSFRLTNTENQFRSKQVYKCIFLIALKNYGNQFTQLERFHRCFVREFKWLSQSQFREVVSLCWTLPGPVTIQVIVTIVTLKLQSLCSGFVAFVFFSLPSWLLLFALGVLSSKYLFHAETLSNPMKLLLFGFNVSSTSIMTKSFLQHLHNQFDSNSKCFLVFMSAAIFIYFQSMNSIVFLLIVGAAISLYLPIENTLKAMSEKSSILLKHAHFSKWFGRRSLYLLIAFYLIGWFVSSFFDQDVYNYTYAFYFIGSFIMGPTAVIFSYCRGIFLPLNVLSEEQIWLGVPFAYLIPGSHINVGIYFGALIDGVRGAIISALCLYLPCFLSLYGILPQWPYYRNKPGVQRLTVGLTCVTTGLLLGIIILSLVHCLKTDVSMTIFIFIICLILIYVWGLYSLIILVLGGLLANARRLGLTEYRLLPDYDYPF